MVDVEVKHSEIKQRAFEVRRHKQETEVATTTTMDDLTQGIVNYKYLALDFEQAGQDQLRFCFTQIDPNDPSKKFWFQLEPTDNSWIVPVCEPQLDTQVVDNLLKRFVDTDDMIIFVRGMRKAFMENLSTVSLN